VELHAPLDYYPFLLRSGCVVAVDEGYGLTENAPLQLLVSALHNGSGEVYFDDGISFDYHKGQFKRISFRFECDTDKVSVEWTCEGRYQPEREFVMQVFLDANCPSKVILNDCKIRQYLYYSAFETTETGWYFDILRKAVIIKRKAPTFSENGKLLMHIPHFSA